MSRRGTRATAPPALTIITAVSGDGTVRKAEASTTADQGVKKMEPRRDYAAFLVAMYSSAF